MSSRCWPFRHRWSLDASRIVRKFKDYQGRDVTTGHETEVLYRCERCEKVKVKTVKGAWKLEELRS